MRSVTLTVVGAVLGTLLIILLGKTGMAIDLAVLICLFGADRWQRSRRRRDRRSR